jgi:perosamine synthetase
MKKKECSPASYIQIARPCVGQEEWEALKEPLLSGWLSQGPQVAAFEKVFAERHGVKFAKATTSCTTALHSALLAMGIGPGDSVIVPSFTWVATANVVEYCGAAPIFCDCLAGTYCMDPESCEAKIREALDRHLAPKALIPVHLFGLCADMEPVLDLARRYGLKVVEDAACAVGAEYHGQMAGGMGDVGCFSFHPRKIITTGEGGICTTNSAEVAERINRLRNHGASLSEEQRHGSDMPYLMPDFDILGFNYRMTDLQGALGLVQMKKLDGLLEERRTWSGYYLEELADLAWLSLPAEPADFRHSWQAFVCTIREKEAGHSRDEILEYLHRNGVGSRVGTHAVHELGYYRKKYGISSRDCPVASRLHRTTLALPLHNAMAAEDYERVVILLRELK